jgi:hypothetical protein
MKLGPMVDVPQDTCPACGYTADAAACVGENAAPSPGDLSICARCCAWLEFDAALRLQPVSSEKLLQIRADPFCRLTEHACRMVKAARN